jgi:hypothetical protein
MTSYDDVASGRQAQNVEERRGDHVVAPHVSLTFPPCKGRPYRVHAVSRGMRCEK